MTKNQVQNLKDQFLSVDRQLKAWRKANRKMKWRIPDAEWRQLPEPLELTEDDLAAGFDGVVLSCGFGDDGSGNSNAVLSGKLAWDFAQKRIFLETWQCRYKQWQCLIARLKRVKR